MILLESELLVTLYDYKIDYLKAVIGIDNETNEKRSKRIKLLFESEELSLENMRNRRKKLLLEIFHPDKFKYLLSDLQLFTEFKSIIENLYSEIEFQRILEIGSNEKEYYSKLAKKEWDFAICYKNVLKREWTKIGPFLKKNEVENLSDSEIKNRVTNHSYNCYMNYKSAYKAADRSKFINDQIHYRGDAAMANYLLGNFLKANLYVLAANLIINLNINNPNLKNEEKEYITKVAAKVKEGRYITIDLPNTDNDNRNDVAFNNMVDNTQRQALQIVNNSMALISANIKINNNNNYYQIDIGFIRELEEKIYKNIFIVLCYKENEFLISVDSSILEIKAKINRDLSSYLKYGIVIFGAVAYGIMKIKDYFTESFEVSEMRRISNEIISILSRANQSFIDKNYLEFLNILSTCYNNNKKLIIFEQNALNFRIEALEIIDELIKYGFTPVYICKILNSIGISFISGINICGKRSSELRGIAANILKSGLSIKLVDESQKYDEIYQNKVRMSNSNRSELEILNERPFRIDLEEMRNMIRTNLSIIYIIDNIDRSRELINEIEASYKEFHFLPINDSLEIIDDLILILYPNIKIENTDKVLKISDYRYAKINDEIRNCYSIDISNECIFDQLCTLSKGKSHNKEQFFKMIEEILIGDDLLQNIFIFDKVKNISEWKSLYSSNTLIQPPLFSKPYLMLLRKQFNFEIFRAGEYKRKLCLIHEPFTYREIRNTEIQTTINLVIDNRNNIIGGLVFFSNHDFSSQWAMDIQLNGDEAQKFLILIEVAEKHKRNGIGHELLSNQLAMQEYKEAINCYEKILLINPMHIDSIFSHAFCLLKMGKNEEVLSILDRRTTVNNYKEYWLYKSISERKLLKISQANLSINRGLSIDINDDLLKKEKQIIDELIDLNTTHSDVVRFYKNNDNINMLSNSRSNNKGKYYKILSLDGGGVRGVMEALLLSEIEKRTKKPISSLFNMLAGTSTGGILAAGLSLPSETNCEVPKFKAYELLNLYTSESDKIFSQKKSLVGSLTNPMYSSENRLTLMKKYFKNVKISHSLTELVLTSVCQTHYQETFLFTRHNALKLNKDYLYVDAVMATTAAPTFFNSHKIMNVQYIDGGVQLNNPSMKACTEAIRYGVNEKDIFVLSIGTGIYASDPLVMGDTQGLLHWLPEINKVLLAAQESNTNIDMHYRYQDRYKRWQPVLPKSIRLDDYKSIGILVDCARDYMTEIIHSDQFNKVLEFLLEE